MDIGDGDGDGDGDGGAFDLLAGCWLAGTFGARDTMDILSPRED